MLRSSEISSVGVSAKQDDKIIVKSIEDSEQLYDPWVQKCYTRAHGACDCNCQWAHQGGLIATGCANLDGSCCHACCCGDRVYRQTHSFYARRFNCEADYGDWRRAWSDNKKRYCCRAYGRGCWTDRQSDLNMMQSTYHYDNHYDNRYDSHYDNGYSRYQPARTHLHPA